MKTFLIFVLVVLIYFFATPFFHDDYPDGPTSPSSYVERASALKRYPHDPQAYTQGLYFHEEGFFESTGLYGHSSIRRVQMNGDVVQMVLLPDDVFGEGLTLMGDELIQLSWKARTAFVYDVDKFQRRSQFRLPSDGWGLTHSERHLVMSDGSDTLYFIDPETRDVAYQMQVHENGVAVGRLNELEWVNGQIYANVFETPYIVRIDPLSGDVLGWIDLSSLLPPDHSSFGVANGIAYDQRKQRLFVTGKNWPALFEIGLLPNNSRQK